MKIDRNKILKMTVILALICIVVGSLTKASKQNSLTLEDYANQNPDIAYLEHEPDETVSGSDSKQPPGASSVLPGASLNSSTPKEQRILYSEGFYYEPLSENLQRYITGISYPAPRMQDAGFPQDVLPSQGSSFTQDADSPRSTPSSQDADSPGITYDDLRYVHIWHYDFEGNPTEGELICNQAIAQDLVEIFYELYRNEYRIYQVRLIEEYDGDFFASMEANNTSCFNYRTVTEEPPLSKHAYGLSVDVNPLYNPYILYDGDGTKQVFPDSAQPYADRSANFPYKIDENDLCHKLFKEHGFIWGGSLNACKAYQHFQKSL